MSDIIKAYDGNTVASPQHLFLETFGAYDPRKAHDRPFAAINDTELEAEINEGDLTQLTRAWFRLFYQQNVTSSLFDATRAQFTVLMTELFKVKNFRTIWEVPLTFHSIDSNHIGLILEVAAIDSVIHYLTLTSNLLPIYVYDGLRKDLRQPDRYKKTESISITGRPLQKQSSVDDYDKLFLYPAIALRLRSEDNSDGNQFSLYNRDELIDPYPALLTGVVLQNTSIQTIYQRRMLRLKDDGSPLGLFDRIRAGIPLGERRKQKP